MEFWEEFSTEDIVLTFSLFAVGELLKRLYEISESLTEIKKALKKVEQNEISESLTEIKKTLKKVEQNGVSESLTEIKEALKKIR